MALKKPSDNAVRAFARGMRDKSDALWSLGSKFLNQAQTTNIGRDFDFAANRLYYSLYSIAAAHKTIHDGKIPPDVGPNVAVKDYVVTFFSNTHTLPRARYGSSYCTLKKLREKADYDEASVNLKGFLKMKDWEAIRIELRNDVDRALGVPIITVSC